MYSKQINLMWKTNKYIPAIRRLDKPHFDAPAVLPQVLIEYCSGTIPRRTKHIVKFMSILYVRILRKTCEKRRDNT